MNDATVTVSTSKPALEGHKQALAGAIGLGAFIWFLLLSGWLGVKPGTVMTKRHNVLFNSDTDIWIERMAGEARLPWVAPHPLQTTLWRGPCRALDHLLGIFLPSEYAGVFAARLLVASVAGIGVGFLAFLALRVGIKSSQCLLLFIIYLLFTQSATVCLPEHFGISNGLLSIAFVAPLLTTSAQLRAIFLGALAILTGGTTITNVLFPLGSLVDYWFKSMRFKVGLLLAAIPAGLGVSLFCYRRSFTVHIMWSTFSHFRVLHYPLSAVAYTVFGLVSPAVGPTPLVLRVPGWDMVSYEPAHDPLRLSYYLGIPATGPSYWNRVPVSHLLNGGHYIWLPAIGAMVWLALLVMCASKGLRDHETRASVRLLLGWLLFNMILHNIWGDEFVLYAPHWSWALMGLVVLGARHLSRTLIATMIVPIVVSQIYTLLAIKTALQSIVR
jgi:hypothetical protein